jgi:hypothetical protein
LYLLALGVALFLVNLLLTREVRRERQRDRDRQASPPSKTPRT